MLANLRGILRQPGHVRARSSGAEADGRRVRFAPETLEMVRIKKKYQIGNDGGGGGGYKGKLKALRAKAKMPTRFVKNTKAAAMAKLSFLNNRSDRNLRSCNLLFFVDFFVFYVSSLGIPCRGQSQRQRLE
jgi:hypothetical protein